jgi:colanic acid biosynthesis protein WcaH
MGFLDAQTFRTVVASTPLVAIDLIVRNENGDVLLGKRKNPPAKDFWFTPGGRIYKGETMEEAFERITEAELGICVPLSEASFHGIYEHFYDDSIFGEELSTHYVVVAYNLNAPIISFNKQEAKDQHDALGWFEPLTFTEKSTVHPHVKWYFQ